MEYKYLLVNFQGIDFNVNWQEISIHVNDGKLKLVTPTVLGDRSLRKLYLTGKLYDEVYEEKESRFEQKMFANLIAD